VRPAFFLILFNNGGLAGMQKHCMWKFKWVFRDEVWLGTACVKRFKTGLLIMITRSNTRSGCGYIEQKHVKCENNMSRNWLFDIVITWIHGDWISLNVYKEVMAKGDADKGFKGKKQHIECVV
jgi:hypothetical protein